MCGAAPHMYVVSHTHTLWGRYANSKRIREPRCCVACSTGATGMASFIERFTDAWVVDRTLFEHLSGGSCSCCGFTHQSAGALMQDCSDIETDDGKKERKSPWPPAMSDEVWTARVKLRAAMKEGMPHYKQFWDTHAREFSHFWTNLPAADKRRTLTMPIDEVPVTLHGKYDLRGAYSEVMCAVNEQLRNFEKTGIKGDGRTTAELSFEQDLAVHRGAYLGKAFTEDIDANVFFDLCQQMGGPRLLPSKPRENRTDWSSGTTNPMPSAPKSNNIDAVDIDVAETEGQSFRADRRLIRLVIFRYMFDGAIRKYEASLCKGEARSETDLRPSPSSS